MSRPPTMDRRPTARGRARPAGFTLIELLVAIGIIVVLVGILLPVIGNVRNQGYVASTQAFISQLSAACEAYQTDFRAYPGPLPLGQIGPGVGTLTSAGGPGKVAIAVPPGYDSSPAGGANEGITGAENLVLGLAGGLKNVAGTITYDPTLVGSGASSLNINQPKRYRPYLDATNLSFRDGASGKTGRYMDLGATAGDTIIPEFLDRFPESMPILYLRASAGSSATGTLTDFNNSVVTNSGTGSQYDVKEIAGYTTTAIGSGRTLKASDYTTPADYDDLTKKHGLQGVDLGATFDSQKPFNAYPYFRSTGASGTTPVARQKDAFVLIAAGKDRVYGTDDDITNFGKVRQ